MAPAKKAVQYPGEWRRVSHARVEALRTVLSFLIPLIFTLAAGLTHAEPSSAPPKPEAVDGTSTGDSRPGSSVPSMVERTYRYRGAGLLHLKFPAAWTAKSAQAMESGRPVGTILFAPPAGDDFAARLAVIQVGADAAKAFDPRAALAKAGQMDLPDSVEKSLTIEDLNGPQVTGSYFTVTDKHLIIMLPRPGEYRYLTQGYAKLDGVVLNFRFVSNRIDGEEKKALLEMIRSASLAGK